jgi:hypothetical protein
MNISITRAQPEDTGSRRTTTAAVKK